VHQRIIEKAGARYSYKGDRIGQGKDNVREYLREHTELADEIESRIREAIGVPAAAAAAAVAEEA